MRTLSKWSQDTRGPGFENHGHGKCSTLCHAKDVDETHQHQIERPRSWKVLPPLCRKILEALSRWDWSRYVPQRDHDQLSNWCFPQNSGKKSLFFQLDSARNNSRRPGLCGTGPLWHGSVFGGIHQHHALLLRALPRRENVICRVFFVGAVFFSKIGEQKKGWKKVGIYDEVFFFFVWPSLEVFFFFCNGVFLSSQISSHVPSSFLVAGNRTWCNGIHSNWRPLIQMDTTKLSQLSESDNSLFTILST